MHSLWFPALHKNLATETFRRLAALAAGIFGSRRWAAIST